jgi:tetratricopeptide (TPR) repeat protein
LPNLFRSCLWHFFVSDTTINRVRAAFIATIALALVLAPASRADENKRPSREEQAGSPETGKSDPLEAEYQKLLEADDTAQEEIDKWIRDHREFAAKGAPGDDEALNRRIMERLAPVRKAYESFLSKNPEHVRARIAFASFLGDIESESSAMKQLEIALRYDTNNATIYNNLANIHGHTGEVKKAFEFYSKAIAINPNEPVYYHNFGTTVYLFRKDAQEYYGIDEQEVFDKAFVLYSNALRLDPTNFPLASDIAQGYYIAKPLRTEDAMKAWTNALSLARDDVEKQGVYIHFARVKMLDGKYDEARTWLKPVTNAMYAELKARVLRSIDQREAEAKNEEPTTGTPAEPKTQSTSAGTRQPSTAK